MSGESDAVTRERVRWAYRTFLDREPESEDAIAVHMAAADFGALARQFIASQEFRQKHSLPASSPHPVPLDLEPNPIEVDVDSETLSGIITHIRRCWEFMGQERPHHSVLTDPSFQPHALAENETAFWASGEHEADSIACILGRHGVSSLDKLVCIDFGCGVGRVTAPLADRFSVVHAYDISEPHIEIAKTRTNKAAFHLVRDIPINLISTDVFHSRIVFQHNPPPIIAILVKNALECLKPGGIAVFQLPTYERGYEFSAKKYINKIGGNSTLDMEMHCLPQHQIFRIATETKCRLLEVREDDSTQIDWGISNTFVIQRELT